MARKKKETEEPKVENEMSDFSIEIKRDIVDIINDSPSLVKLGDKEYVVKNMRYYALYRICRLVMDMRKADETLDTDNAVITALCTDLDAMCEIMAIVLCNHRFTPDDIHGYDDVDDVMSRNDKMVAMMKAKVMNSTFDTNQWAAIILGAIKSIDLSGFFLLKKSVSTLTDSLLMRKKKSEETASLFMEALSLQTQATSSEHSLNTD
ncbi:MAG: hypothetical protein IIZ94_15945 [Prevotella sp.]|nr:hypothetical protein [Prevotella sp.]